MSIEKIITDNSIFFDDWSVKLDDYIKYRFYSKTLDEHEGEQIFYQTNDLLIQIAKNFFSYGKFKDSWNHSKVTVGFPSQQLVLQSLKTETSFDWGIVDSYFSLDLSLLYAENLRYMKDDFWRGILELSNYGEFKFVENATISSKEMRHFRNNASTIFRILRNYMLSEIEYINNENTGLPNDLDLGWLQIRWKIGTDWAVLLENSCKAFKVLYKLNYKLWKVNN